MTRNPNEIETAVSRTLRDSLEKLQRTTEEVNQAINDLVSACASTRPSNSLPPMLRAQTSAASLLGSLEVLSRFVIAALQPPPGAPSEERSSAGAAAVSAAAREVSRGAEALPQTAHAISQELPASPAVISEPLMESQPVETPAELRTSDMVEEGSPVEAAATPAGFEVPEIEPIQQRAEEALPDFSASNTGEDVAPSLEAAVIQSFSESVAQAPPDVEMFDISTLPQEERDLHKRADRVAKVAMQDIKMLHPNDVKLGRENNDLCSRLREDIERAHREYERRFHSILDHPVDYFYNRMVEILGNGNPEALGEYPYPSPVLRR